MTRILINAVTPDLRHNPQLLVAEPPHYPWEPKQVPGDWIRLQLTYLIETCRSYTRESSGCFASQIRSFKDPFRRLAD